MRPHLIICMILLALPAIAEEILLHGNDPLAVTTSNPDRAHMSSTEKAGGGLDDGMPGDTTYYMLSVTDVGKRFYQTPDSMSLHIDTTNAGGDVTIGISVYMGTYGSRNGLALWDGKPILDINSYGRGNERVETLTATVTPEPGIHELQIADRQGEGAYINIDAIKLCAEGGLVLVDANGDPIELHSAADPADQTDAMHVQLDALPNLATIGPGVKWKASETFPVSSYDLRAALDDNTEDNNYWAGGTPPPHAAVIEYPQPITVDTCRISWMGQNRGIVYGLEAFDGERWRLIIDERHNLLERPVYTFESVTPNRIRFTLLEVSGQQRVLMKQLELFSRAGGDAQ